MPSGGYSSSARDVDNDQGGVISALFGDVRSARDAILELRDIGVAPGNISVISRDEDQTERLSGSAEVAREEVGEEALTYRASDELPNDEDLPTTEAQMTGRDVPVSTDFLVPPDEPWGGSDRLGLARDSDMVRRNDADSNADIDIYTDFPDEPGGVNPDSPVAGEAEATEQAESRNRTGAGGSAAAGAGLGALAGLLLGLTGLAVPGVGPLLAAGPLAAALGGLLAGGAAGGIIGALATIGVPEEYAREYASAIEQGQTLVSARTDPLSRDHVERVLTAHGGQSIR